MSGFLEQAAIFLLAAVICVPLVRRMGMASILGYLVAGMLIGPSVLGFVGGAEGKDILHISEFGVVMMLFLIGLELEPAAFWRMRRLVIGMGGLQMGLTTLLLWPLGMYLGLWWQASLACSLALAMSSTAIVLQALKEKGISETQAGRSAFAVLLFQDIAVIPILALLPLLAVPGAMSHAENAHHGWFDDYPGWVQTLGVLGAVALVIASGRYVINPLIRIAAQTHLREMFTAVALLIVVAVSWLMEMVGVSPALGAFLAGVVLANSEYRHELESDIEPFKGLLLGLFFIAVGASINFELIAGKPMEIGTLVAAIMTIKVIVLLIAGRIFTLRLDQYILFSFILAQAGEFGFVLFNFIGQLSILSPEQTDMMMAVVTVTMTLTPLLLFVVEKYILEHVGASEEPELQKSDNFHSQHPVIIAGFGNFGSLVGRFLRANNVNATYLDNDSQRVEMLRKLGFKVYFGDATRLDLLKSAGADQAKLLVVSTDDPDTNIELFRMARKHFPHLKIMVRARNRFHAYDLIEAGAEHIYRDTIDTSMRMGVDVLAMLGRRRYSAYRSAQMFMRYDEQTLWKMAPMRKDRNRYASEMREHIKTHEELIQADFDTRLYSEDHSWDSDQLRKN